MKSDPKPQPAVIPGAKVIRHLGSGGFADVFLYQQEAMRRRVAIKIQRSGISPELDQAFRAEVELLARVSGHPAIVSVHDAGVTTDGRQYMVMEYCPSPSLSGHIKMREFTAADVADIGIRLAGALASLHALGILHRDVKPANILLTEFGHPVLTDFGLAVSLKADKLAAGRGFSVPWAPPEQHNSREPMGVAGDIYSLAATLYTMLARRAPFQVPGGDNSELTMIARVLKAPIPPIGRVDVPARLEQVLVRAMAKDPKDRYHTAIALAQDLQRVQVELNERTTPIDVFSETYSAKHMNEQRGEETRQAISLLLAQTHSPATGVARIVAPSDEEAAGTLTPPATQADGGDSDATTPASSIRRVDSARSGQPAAEQAAGGASPTPAPAPEASAHDAHLPAGASSGAATSSERSALMTVVWVVVAAVVTAMAFLVLQPWLMSQDSEPVNIHEQVDDRPTLRPTAEVTHLRGALTERGVVFTWDAVTEDATFLYRVVDPLDSNDVLRTRDTSVTVPPEPGRTCLEVAVRFKDGTASPTVTECVDTP